MEVQHQWTQGTTYPRWAGLSHWGYGETRFLFYPPASWMLGAVLGSLLPWKIVPGAYCWLVLTLAGVSMYLLCRRWLPPTDALFAAAFYAGNPYFLVIVYWRSAYAELLAAIFIPIVVFCLLRLEEEGTRPILWLGLALGASWLTNGPSAVMIHYSVAGLAIVLAGLKRSPMLILRAEAGTVCGMALAAFYLLPAIYEQRWIDMPALMSGVVMPQNNFLFTLMTDPDHNRFNILVSVVALSEIAALVFAVWFSWRKHQGIFDRGQWILLATWGAATSFVMLPVSNVLWEHLPKFRFVQLPFRWLLCLNVPIAVLMALATVSQNRTQLSKEPDAIAAGSAVAPRLRVNWPVRVATFLLLLGVVIVTAYRTQPPWWEDASDIDDMRSAILDGSGYEGVDEYVPLGADPYEIKKDLPQVSETSEGDDENSATISDVHVLEWNALHKHFIAQTKAPATLTLRLFNYPAWKVSVNGHPVDSNTSEVTGLLQVPVEAGMNDIVVSFVRTRDRTIGGLISILSAVAFGIVIAATKRQPRSPLSGEVAA